MSVRATETATCSRSAGWTSQRCSPADPSAFKLKRRLASLLSARHRSQLRHLAVSLGGEVAAPPAEDAARAFAELEYCGPPDSTYIRRMATFHDFDSLALWGFLTSGTLCPLPARADAARRGRAVDRLLPHDQRRGREGAGARRPAHPRRAGGAGEGVRLREPHRRSPSPVTAVTRERALLLVLPRDPFEQLFNGEDAVSRVFLDVIQRDLVATLRQAFARTLASRRVSSCAGP